MAEKPTSKHVTGLNTSSPLAASKSPDSDISPHTKPSSSVTADYFSASSASDRPPQVSFASGLKASDPRVPDAASPPIVGALSSGTSTTTVTSSFGSTEDRTDTLPSRQGSNDSGDRPIIASRKSSTASVTFRPPRNPSLPQGIPRKTDNQRLRHSSPEPVK
ncbi:hypothetical protein QBC35DRAFT_450168 [Podospora australis]|uniref:Uncharacterized protein n=1 Tax=Podospora australis TaxID=1536484 RepID=A0AAN6WXU9_9PEZI|nr:hypothetical protein QBC35DRAFT_450168 [Podospora australis]